MSFKRKRVVASGITAVLAAGGLAVAAPSAHAASQVSFCFVWAEDEHDGTNRGGKAYAREPVRLIQVVNGQKIRLRTARTDSAGCGVFRNTPTRGRLYVRAVTTVAYGSTQDSWAGRTRSTGPGDAKIHLGTALVKLRGSVCCAVSRPPG